jgi:cell division inhibitor SepF
MATPIRSTLEYLGLVDSNEEQSSYLVQENYETPQTRYLGRNKKQNIQETSNEIFTIHPKQYSDVKIIANNFREGIPIIINLTQMEISEARRVIDFVSGLSQALYGSIEKVTSKVFLLSPEYLTVSGDEANDTGTFDTTFFTSK